MRPLSLVVACVLMACAAYGLSPRLTNEDYCLADAREQRWWPPGVRCELIPSAERGTYPVSPPTGDVTAFFAILAVGLAFVVVRRSRPAIASAIVFGVAGIAATFITPVDGIFFGLILGGPFAYLVGRSFAVAALP